MSAYNPNAPKTYSLRAECRADVEELEKLIRRACATSTVFLKPRTNFLSDAEVEIRTQLSFNDLLVLIRTIPDGHVMLQTLQAVPLSENSLERDYDRH